MGVLLDATFLIDLAQGDAGAIAKAKSVEAARLSAHLPAPAVFEVLTGLLFRRSRTETAAYERATSRFPVLPFDATSAHHAAEVGAELYRRGTPKAAADVMIAGIALQHHHALVTRDTGFDDIAEAVGLVVETY